MQSGNLYVYCISNPVAYVDPVGTLAFLASLLVRMAVGAIINIATTFIAAKVTGQEVNQYHLPYLRLHPTRWTRTPPS